MNQAVISVRLAEPTTADIEALAGLLVEIEHHYGIDPAPPLSAQIRHVEQRILGLGSSTYVGLAFQNERPIGCALFAPVHMGVSHGGMVYLKDLYVSVGARGAGAGTALMRLVASVGEDLGCTRIDLTAHPDNRVLDLYTRLGAVHDEARNFYTIRESNFLALAEGKANAS